jgi:hypothetical protein
VAKLGGWMATRGWVATKGMGGFQWDGWLSYGGG